MKPHIKVNGRTWAGNRIWSVYYKGDCRFSIADFDYLCRWLKYNTVVL